MKNEISLRGVNLHYASVAFRNRSIKAALAAALRVRRRQRRQIIDIHALKDVTATIGGGERVALLGRNGAGKSTFLRMVAGVYPVSSGERRVRGTVRALFDLSLGFEPEATGRENILYRGLLLGLTPRYLRSIEAEIVAFADIGEFIDYPIKTYSAGMQVRLAFAISTAISGDILLLDEVIGAGDRAFMAKARQRLLNLVERAEILVLASHDMVTLTSLCQRGIVLHHGRIVFDGGVEEAVARYKAIDGVTA